MATTRKPSAPKKPRIKSSASSPKRKPASSTPVARPEPRPAAPKRGASILPSPPAAATKQARERALACAAAGLAKKAQGVEIIDVTGRVDYADYLVLMTGTSDRHVASLVQEVEEELKKSKSRALSVEGMPQASWVLVDFGDVVVHVFQTDTRSLYDIDGLWMDASRVPVPDRSNDSASRR